MNAAVPEIKISHNADAQRIRRPYAKVNAANAGKLAHVRAKLFIFLGVRAFTGKEEIVVGEQRRKSIRVKRIERIAIRESEIQAIRSRRNFLIVTQLADAILNNGFEHAARM